MKTRLKHPVPPSYSTFVNHTTTRPGVFNVAGNNTLAERDLSHTGFTGTFGRSSNSQMQTGLIGSNTFKGSISYNISPYE